MSPPKDMVSHAEQQSMEEAERNDADAAPTTPRSKNQYSITSSNSDATEHRNNSSKKERCRETPPSILYTKSSREKEESSTEGESSSDSHCANHTSTSNVFVSPLSDGFFSPRKKSRLPLQETTPLLPPPESCFSDSSDGHDQACGTHAQSFLLGLAFFALWTPQNLMAPNLTQIASYYDFSAAQRDNLLGANLAFATGVFSLPLSGLLGFLADVVPNRTRMYALVVVVGGVASILSGMSTTYGYLFFARFLTGGCMAGSTPIAFSLLSDFFHTKERNAASSGLTAMMGGGIIIGQVFSGMVGQSHGWRFPFYVSGALCFVCALLVVTFVKEPVRGGKEEVVQDILKKGGTYDRKLTLSGFLDAMTRNRSNLLLMLQGFFTSIPWGLIFVFLNDFLSQEQGLSVPDATFLVFMFGLGSAVGGILGGYWGQVTTQMDRSYMPIFMAVTTLLGIVPFVALLNQHFHSASPLACFYALMGGMIANLPGVNVRPMIINVNPPEMRGSVLTASNLIINLARGIAPYFMTIMDSMYDVDRKFSFNFLIILFWVITAIVLLLLSQSLPGDQDKMEEDLNCYARSLFHTPSHISIQDNMSLNDDDDSQTIVSIEDRMTTFDVSAVRGSLNFMGESFRDIFHLQSGDARHQSYKTLNEDQNTVAQYPLSKRNNKRWKSLGDIPERISVSSSDDGEEVEDRFNGLDLSESDVSPLYNGVNDEETAPLHSSSHDRTNGSCRVNDFVTLL